MVDGAHQYEAKLRQLVSAQLRANLTNLHRSVAGYWVLMAGGLDQPLPAQAQPVLREWLRRQIGKLRPGDLAPLLRDSMREGIQLGVYGSGGDPGMPVRVSRELNEAAGRIDSTIRDVLVHARHEVRHLEMNTYNQFLAVLAKIGVAANRAESTAVWAAHRAVNDGVAAVARDGVQQPMVWIPEPDACLTCLAYAGLVIWPGQTYPAGLTFGDSSSVKWPITGPPAHPFCFPAGTIVSGPRVARTYQRWYSGELVEIRTQGGNVLAGTPNHPILTKQGWIGIGQLHQGSDVATRCGGEGGASAVHPDEHQEPTRIEQVPRALLMTGGVATRGVASAPEHFHGDGADGQVDIVTSGSFLRRGTQIPQPFGKEQFSGTSSELSVLSGDRIPDQRLLWAGTSSDTRTSGHRTRQVLFGGLVLRDNPIGVGYPPQLHPGAGQGPGDYESTGAVGCSESHDAPAGPILFDQVVEIRRYPFAGHVYNLETVGGWYNANGIVAHNCRCELGLLPPDGGGPDDPFVEATLRQAQRSVLDGRAGASEPAKLRAADGLLRSSVPLLVPKTVVRRARERVAGR